MYTNKYNELVMFYISIKKHEFIDELFKLIKNLTSPVLNIIYFVK